MQRIAIFDEIAEHAIVLRWLCRSYGRIVRVFLTPIPWHEVASFRPDLCLVGLQRRPEAYDRPIHDFMEDVWGALPLLQLASASPPPAPLIALASGLHQADLPALDLLAFLRFPCAVQELGPLLSGISDRSPF